MPASSRIHHHHRGRPNHRQVGWRGTWHPAQRESAHPLPPGRFFIARPPARPVCVCVCVFTAELPMNLPGAQGRAREPGHASFLTLVASFGSTWLVLFSLSLSLALSPASHAINKFLGARISWQWFFSFSDLWREKGLYWFPAAWSDDY